MEHRKSGHKVAYKKESAGRKIATIIISLIFTIVVLLIANLHYRNYIDTQTQNALPLGAQTGSKGGYAYSTTLDDKYRWFVEDFLKLDLKK